jgi:Fe-S oxidoreductase
MRVLVFADMYTNYLYPESGMATVNVLHALGAQIAASAVLPEGRAALSQGMIETAAFRARRVAAYLSQKIDEGWMVVVPEPSVLALFRRDYKNLLQDDPLFEKIQRHSMAAAGYVAHLLQTRKETPEAWFDANRSSRGKHIFLHGHCQRKSLKAHLDIQDIFRAAGFDVVQSQVECCGMAGSFGYKKQFYDISIRIGEELFRQIREADNPRPRILVASGISCRHQIEEGVGRRVFHPLEILEEVLVRKG